MGKKFLKNFSSWLSNLYRKKRAAKGLKTKKNLKNVKNFSKNQTKNQNFGSDPKNWTKIEDYIGEKHKVRKFE